MSQIYEFVAQDLMGNPVAFSDFQGKALLIVNTASQCGLTPQFAQLQELHTTYQDKGLVIIGFPCNQFGKQEPLDGEHIGEFCQLNYGVDFLMMAKIDVNGDHAHPLYKWLKSEQSGLFTDAIKWNFTKFLVDRQGQVIGRYAPTTKPKELVADIEKALK